MKHDVSVIQNNYLLFLQKKCQVLNKGSHRATAGKYLTSLISLYTLWRLCPSCDLPNRFRASCFPKFPASSTLFSTNLPYFSFGGTIRREAGVRCKPLGYINAFPCSFRIQVLNPFFRNYSETRMADSFSRTFAFSNICLSVIIINISFYLSNI